MPLVGVNGFSFLHCFHTVGWVMQMVSTLCRLSPKDSFLEQAEEAKWGTHQLRLTCETAVTIELGMLTIDRVFDICCRDLIRWLKHQNLVFPSTWLRYNCFNLKWYCILTVSSCEVIGFAHQQIWMQFLVFKVANYLWLSQVRHGPLAISLMNRYRLEEPVL